LSSKRLAQPHHIRVRRLIWQMFLSHSVDLPFDQIACHGFARPPFGNHGAQGGSLRFKQGCLVWAVRWSLGRGVRWLTAQVQGKVRCLCDHRTAKHRLKLCARLQPVQNLACLKNRSQTARRLRPFARRALITARPPRVRMRARKPWVRARLTLEG